MEIQHQLQCEDSEYGHIMPCESQTKNVGAYFIRSTTFYIFSVAVIYLSVMFLLTRHWIPSG